MQELEIYHWNVALNEQRKRRRDEKAYYKENKKEKIPDKPEDEGCPNSPTSVESDDTFHVTNNHIVRSIIESQSAAQSTKQEQRPTVLRSSVKNCPCGCEYVNLIEMELEYEEEIDVESLWIYQTLLIYFYREKPRMVVFSYFIKFTTNLYYSVYLCD